MILSWSPIEGSLAVTGSRKSTIEMFWRWVPDEEKTPIRRKLIIAMVDNIREHHAATGKLAPPPLDQPEVHCDCGKSYVGAECYGNAS